MNRKETSCSNCFLCCAPIKIRIRHSVHSKLEWSKATGSLFADTETRRLAEYRNKETWYIPRFSRAKAPASCALTNALLILTLTDWSSVFNCFCFNYSQLKQLSRIHSHVQENVVCNKIHKIVEHAWSYSLITSMPCCFVGFHLLLLHNSFF